MNVHQVMDACKKGDIETVKYLVKHGGDRSLAVRMASSYGCLDIVKYFVESEPDEQKRRDIVTSHENCAVRFASSGGYLDIIKFLVENGADISDENSQAVCWACDEGHVDVVKFLFANGAGDYYINWCVKRASKRGYTEIVKILLSRGAYFYNLTRKHQDYFRTMSAFRRWRMVIFRRFFRKTVIPLYYSPGFPGAIKAKLELSLFVPQTKNIN